MAELPAAIRARLRLLQLPPADVLVLADDITAVHYYDEVVAAGAPAKAAANWVMGELMAACKAGIYLLHSPWQLAGSCVLHGSSAMYWHEGIRAADDHPHQHGAHILFQQQIYCFHYVHNACLGSRVCHMRRSRGPILRGWVCGRGRWRRCWR